MEVSTGIWVLQLLCLTNTCYFPCLIVTEFPLLSGVLDLHILCSLALCIGQAFYRTSKFRARCDGQDCHQDQFHLSLNKSKHRIEWLIYLLFDISNQSLINKFSPYECQNCIIISLSNYRKLGHFIIKIFSSKYFCHWLY